VAHIRPRAVTVFVAAAALFGTACGGAHPVQRADRPMPRPSAGPAPGPRPPPPPPGLLAALPEPTRSRLVATAGRWLGRRGPFTAAGRSFRADCSGYVEAVYESHGIPIRDIVALRPSREGSAAVALHRAVRELGVLYGAEREPLPGDLVFFEHTYDRNRNREADDGVTHAGLVEEVLPNGAVVFLHRGSRGVARGRLHLGAPGRQRGEDGAPLNTPLRAAARGDPGSTRTLAGQLFAGFGRIDPARVAALLEGNERLDLGALGYGEGPPLELPPGASDR